MIGGELTECAVDGQPADGAVLCGGCVAKLQIRLGHVPSLVEELEVTITRQDKLTANKVGSRGSETPSPFNERASDVRRQLRDRLGSWCRDVAERSGLRLDIPPGAEPTVEAARWLAQHPGTVRHHPAAADLFEEVCDDIRAAFQVIDRPPDSVFAGRCDCGGLLYARPGNAMATCRALECGLAYGVEEMREWMLGQLEYREGSSVWVSSVLKALGISVPAGTIRRWASLGKLERLPGHRYRVGAVVEVTLLSERPNATAA